MRFDERFLEEIKTRLRPSEVIGRTVQLRRAGREYVGLSPFTKERTPSFYVNDEKGSFFDCSSGKSGDLIAFLQESERLSFREAVERLAAEAGVPLPSPDPRQAERERQDLYGWMEEAARWFEAQLRRSKGEGARRYLDERAVPEDVRTRFRLGYAPPDRTTLRDHLVAKGARPADLVEAGLLVAPEGGGQPFDRFRHRIMFPIADGRGRIVSFGGRALDPQQKAKYLNGPETPLFHKGATLYLLPEAKTLLRASDVGEPSLVVVEGYLDAIACQRAGVAAVAPLGTALTEDQMAALWRLALEPVLAFDGDAAGAQAAHKAIDRALPHLQPRRSFRFAFLKSGKDPDEVLREKGAAVLQAELAETRSLAEVLFERERVAAEPLDTPERRTGSKVNLRKLAGAIADPDLAQAYREEWLRRLEVLWPAPIRADAERATRSGGRRTYKAPLAGASEAGKAAARRLSRSLSPAAAAAALGLVMHPELADEQLEILGAQGFGEPALEDLAWAVVQMRLTSPSLDAGGVRRHLDRAGFVSVLEAIAAVAADAPFLQSEPLTQGARALWTELLLTLTRLAAVEQALQDAKSALDGQQGDFAAFFRLKSERDALKRRLGSGPLWRRSGAALD